MGTPKLLGKGMERADRSVLEEQQLLNPKSLAMWEGLVSNHLRSHLASPIANIVNCEAFYNSLTIH